MKGEPEVKLTLQELCDPYRQNAANEQIGAALVADRADAKRLLAAFALFPLPRWRRPRSRMPEDHRERWLWLWSGFDNGPMEPDFLVELAIAAGISEHTAYAIWPALMTSRVLYPDGRISDGARDLLIAHVERKQPKAKRA